MRENFNLSIATWKRLISIAAGIADKRLSVIFSNFSFCKGVARKIEMRKTRQAEREKMKLFADASHGCGPKYFQSFSSLVAPKLE